MSPAPATIELAPRYYRDNFERLVEVVHLQYEDLLQARELDFLQAYEAAGEVARCLYIRLVSRRGPLFRSEQLSYPELGLLDEALGQLLQLGLLKLCDTPVPEALFKLLRKAELQDIYVETLGDRRATPKRELEELLLEELDESQILRRWLDWREPNMLLLEPDFREVIELLQLLFFGNRRQSLTDFVLSDLGVMNYESYSLDRVNRLFADRGEVDDYLHIAVLGEQFFEALEEDEREAVTAMVPALLPAGASQLLEARRDRLRNRVARQLERWECWSDALSLYRVSGQHPARERQVRILQGLGELQAALTLCTDMNAAPWCESERDFLRRQIPQISKKLGMAASPTAKDQFEEERIILARAERVELAAAEYYEKQWQSVHYVENSLVNAVFGLAFWEQIFLPLPGAFVNPFQSAPRDMYSRDFLARREAQISERLGVLSSCDLVAELLRVHDAKQGIANSWINWRYLDRALLELALSLIPGAHWQALWRRTLFDPGENRSGLPDLIALDADKGYSFIEIKGPGDQLQHNQRRWLRYFQQCGIPASVAWVSWKEDGND